ncbi:MAG: competence/damage-inducible protein A [Deltaproteobacteria bacterium]|nr:MAG: competence/damage-inducible protein A [Deltaproteobacteria bacterium]
MGPSPDGPRRAAALLIGNELLSGKIRDENGWHLARFLRRRGIELAEMAVVPDDVDEIARALARLVGRHPLVFTSGGVGPTHDDRTLAAVAAATGRPLERHAGMEALLRDHYGEGVGEAALAMADLPRGTVPCALPGWPVLRLDTDAPAVARIYILPGVPELFRSKLERLAELPGELPEGPGWVLEVLDLAVDEAELAAPLAEVAAAEPDVEIGSYPRWIRDERGRLCGRVRVTVEGPVAARDAVLRAFGRIRNRFADRVAAGPPP